MAAKAKTDQSTFEPLTAEESAELECVEKLLLGAEELYEDAWVPTEVLMLLIDVPSGNPIWEYAVKAYILGLLGSDPKKIGPLKRLWRSARKNCKRECKRSR